MSQFAKTHTSLLTKAPVGAGGEASFTLELQLPSGRRATVLVTRKRVKNLNLRVKREGNGALEGRGLLGSVRLSIPLRTSTETAQRFLEQKAPWIDAQLDKMLQPAAEGDDHNTEAPPEDIPLWGALVPVSELADLRAVAQGATGHDATPHREDFDACLEAFYREEVRRALPEVVPRMEAAVGVHANRWQVRTMSTRWGSCTIKTAAIRINGGLAAYPPICLECTVAHELTHLLEPSHNARFHALLEGAYPRACEAEALLKLPARTVALRR